MCQGISACSQVSGSAICELTDSSRPFLVDTEGKEGRSRNHLCWFKNNEVVSKHELQRIILAAGSTILGFGV